MSSNNTMHVKDINQYHQRFKDQAVNFSRGPVQNRGCQDKCCYFFFILITVAFVVIGVYFIQAAKLSDLTQNYLSDQNPKHLATETYEFPGVENLKPAVPVIIGMLGLAVLTAVLFLLLLIKFPQCMFYSILAFSAILMVVLIIVLLIANIYIAAIILLVILLIFACFLFCNRDRIRTGIVLLNTAASFLSEKKTVFLAPFFILIFVVVFQVFWLASLVGIILYKGEGEDPQTESQVDSQQDQNSHMLILWSFFHIFYSVFFNYCMTFIIATACALWYFNIDSNYLFTAVSRIIKSHIGSFTFASILITIVTMIRQTAEEQSRENGACSLCFCLLACCVRFIEELLDTLNHNSIIVMSVTGESYIDSAKSTISLIFDNFSLFVVVDIISSIVKFTGIILICGVPSFVGYFLLRETAENPDDDTYVAIGMVAIILISILIGILFLGVLSEALSCVFIFFCFDKKFHDFGYQITNQVPHEMRQLFQSLESSKKVNSNSGQRAYHGQSFDRPQRQLGGNYPQQQPYAGNNNYPQQQPYYQQQQPYAGNNNYPQQQPYYQQPYGGSDPYQQGNPYHSRGNSSQEGYPSLDPNNSSRVGWGNH